MEGRGLIEINAQGNTLQFIIERLDLIIPSTALESNYFFTMQQARDEYWYLITLLNTVMIQLPK